MSADRAEPGALVAIGVPVAALVYFLLAPSLPALPVGDETTLVAGGVGLLMVAASALALLGARETVIGPALILLGSALVVAALNAAGVGAAANVFEAFLAGAAGLLLARVLGTPAVAVAVPVFVAAIDVVSALGEPESARRLTTRGEPSDPLSFDLPAWGDLGGAGRLGVAEVLFLAMFAAWAWRFGLRRGPTVAGLGLALIAALVLEVALDRAVPVLALLAAGYLLPNLDRLGALSRGRTPE